MTQLTELYLAGGCFWGVEAYFAQLPGVHNTSVGYANGYSSEAQYTTLAQTGHAETVHIVYDPSRLSLTDLLRHYFRIIDPFSLNQQGGDRGPQYRTGIYTTNESDLVAVQTFVAQLQNEVQRPIAVEVQPLRHYVLAETYHQNYLAKNPNGYCHIDISRARDPLS